MHSLFLFHSPPFQFPETFLGVRHQLHSKKPSRLARIDGRNAGLQGSLLREVKVGWEFLIVRLAVVW